MENATAEEVLSSVEHVRRRARDTALGSGWMTGLASGALVAITGWLSINTRILPWIWIWVAGLWLVFFLGTLERTRRLNRFGIAPMDRRWMLGLGPSVVELVGAALLALGLPFPWGRFVTQARPGLALLALVGGLLVVVGLGWAAVRMRDLAYGIAAVGLAAAAAAAWLAAPGKFAGLMWIAVGICFIGLALVYRLRLPRQAG
jgi:hypothetical protein